MRQRRNGLQNTPTHSRAPIANRRMNRCLGSAWAGPFTRETPKPRRRGMFTRRMPHTGHAWHFLLAVLAPLTGTGCMRFGYEVMGSFANAGAAGWSADAAPIRNGGNAGYTINGSMGGVGGALVGAAGSTASTPSQAGSTNGGVAATGGIHAGGSTGTSLATAGGNSASLHTGMGGVHSAGSPGVGAAGAITTAGGALGSGGVAVGGSSASSAPSCAAQLLCQAESCCSVISAPAGSYSRGVPPISSVTLHAVYIDKYEVTVGRFRAFLLAYDAWRAALHPNAGEGAYETPVLAQSGWEPAWNAELPASASAFEDATHLASCGARSTWTASAGTGTPNRENYPINCVSWYEALAFCIWDGGRLPTEAEWQYVSGGGSEDRMYPWGDSPNSDPLPANYYYNRNSPFTEVGSEPNGQGRWGHHDLAGSISEWCLDWYASDYPSACNDCANLVPGSDRTNRGGTWSNSSMALQTGSRGFAAPFSRLSFTGIRCARNAP